VKALLLSHAEGGGGAGRATQRLFSALDGVGVDVALHTDYPTSDDPRVFSNTGPFATAARRMRISISEVPAVLARHPQPSLFSAGLTSAIDARRIDSFGADIVNVHWTGYGYLSIRQLGRIRTPTVLTMHDMWAFTGGAYYDDEGPDARWRSGYTADNRLADGTRFDVERWVAGRKRRNWPTPRHAITPSTWLTDLARQSDLLGDWSMHVIPNALDLELFQPGPRAAARDRLGLPKDKAIVMVMLGGRLDDPRKGFDLLREALGMIAADPRLPSGVELAVVGHGEAPADWESGLPRTHWLGYVDDATLVAAYCAADVVMVPSRQDNLPQTATEALACGVPVVSFDIGGLPDIVLHEETGYRARPEDAADLAHGIRWVLSDDDRRARMGERARQRAVELWSPHVVGRAHKDLFASIIDERRPTL
jgi:glycosyltransferase involved in cell wall biosynthesis